MGSVSPQELIGYSDSNWGADPDKARSTTGLVFLLNGPVSWRARLQQTVAKSSTAAEFMALAEGTEEALWLRALLKGLTVENYGPTKLLCDNSDAIKIAGTKKTFPKHIDIRYHYVLERIQSKELILEYVQTESNLADGFTKPLGSTKFRSFSNRIVDIFDSAGELKSESNSV